VRGLLCCVLGQQLQLGALHPLPKVIGSKHFQKDPTELGHAAQQNSIMLGLDQPDPKHFKRGWVWMPSQIH